MVINQTYKNYSSQIAELFCKDQQNKSLCKASLTERLNTFLDDYTYPYFLSKLNSGRTYITNLEAFQNKGFRIVVTDLITGDRATAWWNIDFNYPYLSKLPGILLQHNFNIISANKTFSELNKSDVRITYNPLKPSYGITFVPGSVGQGNGTPGGGVPGGTPGGGNISITPNQPAANPAVQSGFDFSSLLSNPAVLIGGGIVLYLLFKDKF